MSNFLNGLVGRTRGTIPVAQPIIAPLFAPGPTMVRSEPEREVRDVVDEVQTPAVQQRRQMVSPSVVPPALPVTKTSVPQPPVPSLKNNQTPGMRGATRTELPGQAPTLPVLSLSNTPQMQADPDRSSPETVHQEVLSPSTEKRQVLNNGGISEVSPILSNEGIPQTSSEASTSYSQKQNRNDSTGGENISYSLEDNMGKENRGSVVKEMRQGDRGELRHEQASEDYQPHLVVSQEVAIDAQHVNGPLVDVSLMKQQASIAEASSDSAHANFVQDAATGASMPANKGAAASLLVDEEVREGGQLSGLPVEQDGERYVPLLKPHGNGNVEVAGHIDPGLKEHESLGAGDRRVGAQFIAPTTSRPVSENTSVHNEHVGARFIAPTTSQLVPNNARTVPTNSEQVQTGFQERGDSPTIQQDKAVLHIEGQQQELELPGQQELLVPVRQQGVVVSGRQEGMPRQQRDEMLMDEPLRDGRSATAEGWGHGTPAEQRGGRLSSQQRKQAQGAETPGAAAIIHVTIGRIDVRAVPAPASPPRAMPNKSGPTLSLQDYLKQNKRGGS